MTILLIILLILVVIYFYYQNQQLRANSRSDFPGSLPKTIFSDEEEKCPCKEAITHLQNQIDELKKPKHHD